MENSHNDPKTNKLAIDFNGAEEMVSFYDGSDIYNAEFASEFPTIDNLYEDTEEDFTNADGDFDYFAKAEQEDESCPL